MLIEIELSFLSVLANGKNLMFFCIGLAKQTLPVEIKIRFKTKPHADTGVGLPGIQPWAKD